MSATTERSGHCLCGAVQISATAVPNEFYACHCDMCRRWGGGPLLAIDSGIDVTIRGERALTYSFENKTSDMTGAEVYAAFSTWQGRQGNSATSILTGAYLRWIAVPTPVNH